ncbi:hypothetical protein Y10_02090 [Neptunitalea sp. Y10]|uniref:ABM domain-containing protein n=2 Tax=Neptunitalea lumnitzerae TaxID=2965509 RepID=A0ABQ5MEQ1_9FLAO|nr:hypothetical protein Y10_02090 [Neptunitalea sp. Y10]
MVYLKYYPMQYTLVEHFLSEEGKNYLPQWIKEIKVALNDFDGFQKLELLEDVTDNERTLFLLQFETLDNLQKWATSETHNWFLKKLHPHMLQKQHSQLLRSK